MSTTSGTVDCNGSNDKMTLKCIDGELDVGGNSAIQMTCKTDEVNVASSFVSASNRFKVKYSSSYCYFSNPSGTNYDDDDVAGRLMAYHDNASVLQFSCIDEYPPKSYSPSIHFKVILSLYPLKSTVPLVVDLPTDLKIICPFCFVLPLTPPLIIKLALPLSLDT